MKTTRFLCPSALALSFVATLALAQPPPPPPPAAGATAALDADDGPVTTRRGERRTLIRRDEMEKETVTFLGVETMPVSPTLTAQLGLPKGAGLVVAHILPNSPAASALQDHDILLKIDDQMLIEPRQFSVLVRNHKESDEVTLTYIRAGKQSTAKVKLTTHEVPKMTLFRNGGNVGYAVGRAGVAGPREREEVDHLLSLVDSGAPRPAARMTAPALTSKPGFRAIQVHPGNSNMVYNDEKGTLDLTIKDGTKTLVAKNTKGEQVFSGPVTTPEERKALAPDLRERLEQLEGMHGFSFKTDDEFYDHVTFGEPDRMKIVLPLADESSGREDAPTLL